MIYTRLLFDNLNAGAVLQRKLSTCAFLKENVFSLRLDKINLDLGRDIHNPSFNPLVSFIVSYMCNSVPSIRTLLNAGKCSLLHVGC